MLHLRDFINMQRRMEVTTEERLEAARYARRRNREDEMRETELWKRSDILLRWNLRSEIRDASVVRATGHPVPSLLENGSFTGFQLSW